MIVLFFKFTIIKQNYYLGFLKVIFIIQELTNFLIYKILWR
ncbi:hypothetical protein XBFM1_840003 [Xenorhabdus bovienii str. feltiae Moldova]|uniref:Uncharacterized protein n=1 Tax=Xenorhabdus bovienii str. feltiae Moldova TaxID=1398200 RepID=A0A077NZA6_XENBV|nr:hypothetical protein XBFM1_840003 [Xenorhabdus bovienii str. feltiae Moldova]